MKFLSIRELRNEPGKVWSEIKNSDVVLTSKGSPIGLLVGVEEDNLESTISALRRARATVAVSRIRKRAAERGTSRMSMAEIDREIRAARRENRKKK
ncbi:MAG: type II toxin-antitoxin system Phd/YefM family antitoxin [Thermoanaerobaculia bacterium]